MKKKTKQVPVPVKEKNKFKDKFFAYLLAGCMIFWTVASVLGIVGFVNTVEKEKAVESSTAVAVSADNIHQVREKKGASNRQVKDKQKYIAIDGQGTVEYSYYLPLFNMLHFSFIEDSSTFVPSSSFMSRIRIRHYDTTFQCLIEDGPVPPADNITSYTFTSLDTPITDVALVYFAYDEYRGMTGNVLSLSSDVNAIVDTSSYFPYSYSISCARQSNYVMFRIDIVYSSISFNEYAPNYIMSLFIGAKNVYAGHEVAGLPYNYHTPTSSWYTIIPSTEIDGVTFYDYLSGDSNSYSYNAGYNEGRLDGRADGYESGYNAGQSVGYNQGYSQGLLDNGGEWSFRSLLTAVVDTPVQVFTDLFNFEILGVNLTGFFLGLFSIALCLGVIKLIF